MTSMEAIKKLRDTTGSGIVDCKKALLENNNDISEDLIKKRNEKFEELLNSPKFFNREGLYRKILEQRIRSNEYSSSRPQHRRDPSQSIYGAADHRSVEPCR